MTKRINVYILAGFLGAGKTTVLNHLLDQFRDEKNIVIENEFGKINIDASLIDGTFESLYELTNGCICCSINNQLLETLNKIVSLETIPDNLFIETTGIADAGEIAANFSPGYVAEHFDLKKVITVVDAENLLFFKDSNPEVTKQIVAADLVVINKSSLVTIETVVAVKDFIKSINPDAPILLSKNGSLDRNHLATANVPKIITPQNIHKPESIHKIKTMLYETEKYFDIQMLRYELFKNMYLYYDHIYRIKGYVLSAQKEVFLVQTTGKTATVTATSNQNIVKSQLVFIGKELELKTIERLLTNAILKDKKVKMS